MNSKSVALILAVCFIVVAFAFQPTTSHAQNTRVPALASAWPENCVIEQKGEYSRGAVLLDRGVRYVCANARKKDWQPMGFTWVRVELRGNDFVLLGPTALGECERGEN